MTTLQLQLHDTLATQLNEVADRVGISRTAYVKTLIAKDLGIAFTDQYPGNVFNAERDNQGVTVPLDDFVQMVESSTTQNK